jgi:hypothetical protein
VSNFKNLLGFGGNLVRLLATLFLVTARDVKLSKIAFALVFVISHHRSIQP